VINQYVPEGEIERFQNLTMEEMKFILKFLVCLVLKNFQTGSLLVPTSSQALPEIEERKKSLMH
jgi:hypothetical protein